MAKEYHGEGSNNLRAATINILLRIALFIMYYVLLIAIGITVFYAAFQISCEMYYALLPAVQRHLKLIFIGGFAFIGLWAFAGTLAFYLVKPLFNFGGANGCRMEITEQDSPLLFACIRSLTEKINVPLPKHVYVNSEVNAYVFYNKGFWRLFLPAGKNMEIGLGLCHAANIDELKAVLAHELGHFSQQTMRITPAVNVIMGILHDLAYTKDSFDNLLDEWCEAEYKPWRWFGKTLRWLIGRIKSVTVLMYGFVERAYPVLQRQKEYDADRIACRAVNTAAFVSSQIKLDWIAGRHNFYERLLINYIAEEGRCPENYWAGYDKIEDYMELIDGQHLGLQTLLPEQESIDYVLEHEENSEYDTHPTTAQRIKNALAVTGTPEPDESAAAWTLFEPDVINAVGKRRIKELAKEADCQRLELVDLKTFRKWVKREIEHEITGGETLPD